MSIYHLSLKTFSRSAGRSAVAACAYRTGTCLTDERTGLVHDYTRRSGVEHTELVLPAGAGEGWDRERLWNAAEAAEVRKNSTVAREFELGLPHELSAEGRQALVRGFAQELAARHGVAVDMAIHAPDREGDNRNHHAHVLVTTRRLGPDGFGEKTRELDARATGPGLVEEWRGRWAALSNIALERAGSLERVDHRSLEAQRADALERGDAERADCLDRSPGIKLGWQAADHLRRAERKGEAPTLERAQQAQAIQRENTERQRLRALLAGFMEQVRDLGLQVAEQARAGIDAFKERFAGWKEEQRKKELERKKELDRQRDGPTLGMSR